MTSHLVCDKRVKPVMFRRLALVMLILVGSATALSPTKPSRKTWWAKKITPDLYVAGKGSEIQMKYASEDGFKSIISVCYSDSPSSIGEDILPDGTRIRELVVNELGLFYDWVTAPTESAFDIQAVEKFTSIVKRAPPPVLLFCNSVVSSAFEALAYLANQTKHNPSFEPKIDSAEFYKRAKDMGIVFTNPNVPSLVSTLTGEPVVNNPPTADLVDKDWTKKYWLATPLSKKVFTSGHIRSNYLDLIWDAGFHVIINPRKGVTTQPNNEPSQEEVTLLNIKDRTGTYEGTGRQSEQRLLETRIDPNKPNSYVGPGSQVNYASRNPFEYGDDIGYNQTLLRLDIEQRYPEIMYFHTPIGGQYKYNVEMWKAYKATWIRAVERNDLILFACRTAYRATISALLTIGSMEDRSSEWALDNAKVHGFDFVKDDATEVIKLFQDVLDKPTPEPSSGYNLAARSSMIAIVSLAIVVLSEL